jgi:hypothetical protein
MRIVIAGLFAALIAVSFNTSASAQANSKDYKCKTDARQACMPKPTQGCVTARYKECMAKK